MQQDLGREAISFISSSDTGRKKKKKHKRNKETKDNLASTQGLYKVKSKE